jgi:hypothetical protein
VVLTFTEIKNDIVFTGFQQEQTLKAFTQEKASSAKKTTSLTKLRGRLVIKKVSSVALVIY